ncbi:hypothetical protein IHE45_01G058800 [Dioscorea alata]|uniref:Uncharacterized protein n=1 Tax=Dioscorea alata TaxID=55571 RepID=A0ACB7WUY9_DIOAL|nr:hypothetical protein IHE45_01G058800 [Dioscorea alata]
MFKQLSDAMHSSHEKFDSLSSLIINHVEPFLMELMLWKYLARAMAVKSALRPVYLLHSVQHKDSECRGFTNYSGWGWRNCAGWCFAMCT